MALQSTNNKIWLVKSAGQILGPFNNDEVEGELRSKRIVVIDEIKSSQDRWKFIRECPDFQNLIATLRDEQLTGHDEGSLTQTGFTQSVTVTILNDDSTPVGKTLLTDTKKVKNKSQSPKYGYSADKKLQVSLKNEKRRVATLAWVLVIFVVGAGAFAYFNWNGKKPKGTGYKDALRLARIEKSLGNYEASLELFKKAFGFKMPTAAGELESLPLVLLTEKQDLQVQRSLERLMSSGNLDEGLALEAQSLMALTFMRQGRFNEAEERLRNILSKHPNNEPAQINLIEISILTGRNLRQVYDDLTRMLKDGFQEKTLILYRAFVALRLFDTEKDPDALSRALQDVERFQSKYLDYLPESLLLQAAIYKKLRNSVALEKTLRELIVTDPEISTRHRQDYLLHQEIFRWIYLGKICENITDTSPKTLPYAGLSVYCAYQQGNLRTALDLAEKARNQYANEPILAGLYAFLLQKSSRDEESSAVLQVPGARDFELGISLHAQQCSKRGDVDCAESDWTSLQKINPRSVDASAGLAKIALDKGRQDSARDWIKRGLMSSKDYKPLLVLERQLNEP
jgi:tetratricopeptide (TPR) repeat protein